MKEEIDKLQARDRGVQRKGDFNKVAELQYGKLPALEKQLKEAQAAEAEQGQERQAAAAAHAGRRRGDRRSGGARHRHPGVQADAGRAREAAA
jgi:hypothetical protein